MRYFCLLVSLFVVLCCLGCWDTGPGVPRIGKPKRGGQVERQHTVEQVKQVLGFNYVITTPPDYQSATTKITSDQFRVEQLSASGAYAVCRTDIHELFLWDIDANTMTPLKQGQLKFDSDCTAGVLDDGRVITIDPQQQVMILDIKNPPQQLTKLDADTSMGAGVIEVAGDWIFWTDRISWHVWNINDKSGALPKHIKQKMPKYFDAYGINADGTVVGHNMSTNIVAIFNSDRENRAFELSELQHHLPGTSDHSISCTDVNDNGLFVGILEGYSEHEDLQMLAFVWSEATDLRIAPHYEQLSAIRFEHVNNQGFIVGTCTVDNWMSSLAIWDAQRLGQGAINISDAIIDGPSVPELYQCKAFANDCSILAETYDYPYNGSILLRPKR